MIEDAIHYFFHCRKFTMERQVFNDTVRVFQPLSIDMILCGNFNLNMENNIVLFRAVHRYIHATKRFKTSWLFALSFPWNIFCILISILMTNLFYSQVEGVPGSRAIIFFVFFVFLLIIQYYLLTYLLSYYSDVRFFLFFHLYLSSFPYLFIFLFIYLFSFIYFLFIDYLFYIYLFIYLFIYLLTYLLILI